jgi:fatty-acyl-CoA synthase
MGPNVTAMPLAAARAKPGSCGLTVPYSQVRIVDPDGNDVAPGQRGEVWISGPSVTPGYFRRNRPDDRAFSGRYFRTGDAAYADDDGFFYLVDRLKEMYKSGGENVYPAEVERVLIEHPAVAEVVVIAVPHEKWGEVGLAVVVARPGQSVTLDELNSWAGTKLARFKQPKSLVLTEALPRNATGKVNRADMRRLYGKVSD